MNDERNVASARARGSARCARGTASASPHRRIARSSGREACCKREVEVGHAGLEDRLDERVGQPRGVQVEEPEPRRRCLSAPRTRSTIGWVDGRVEVVDVLVAGAASVTAVAREVLGDEHELARAAIDDERLGLLGEAVERRRERWSPRNVGIAQKPHRRSQPSATLTYAHGAVAAGRGSAEQVERRRDRAEPELDGHDRGDRRLAEARDEVDLGERDLELLAVALGHAARDDDLGAGLAPLGELEDDLDRLGARAPR